ncbi:hypothetical protein D3C71_2174280 [compost metagenome]
MQIRIKDQGFELLVFCVSVFLKDLKILSVHSTVIPVSITTLVSLGNVQVIFIELLTEC